MKYGRVIELMISDLCTHAQFQKRSKYYALGNKDFYRMCVIIFVKGLESRDRQDQVQASFF